MEWTLEERINALKSKPESLGEWKCTLQTQLTTVKDVGNWQAVLDALVGLIVDFLDDLCGVYSAVPPDGVRKKMGSYIGHVERARLLPREIGSLLRNVSEYSSVLRHREATVNLGTRDALLALDNLLRVLEWFFTDCPKGPRLESIDDLPEHLPETYNAFSLPIEPRGFVGRQDELEALHENLANDDTVVSTIGGPAGQGKTFLAARVCQDLRLIWHRRWVDCNEGVTVEAMLRDFASDLRGYNIYLPRFKQEEPLQRRLDKLVDCLNKDERRWFLVLDDFHKVEDDGKWNQLVETFAKHSRGAKLLLTTRQEPGAHWDPKLPPGAHDEMRLQPLVDDAVAHEYLRKCGLTIDESISERIREKCGGVPLAMTLFAQAARKRAPRELLALNLRDWSDASSDWLDEFLDMNESETMAAHRLAIFDEPIEPAPLLHIGAKQENGSTKKLGTLFRKTFGPEGILPIASILSSADIREAIGGTGRRMTPINVPVDVYIAMESPGNRIRWMREFRYK